MENDRVSWRGNSGLGDGREADLDLTKGMYDAGDMVKFGFPMAFTATVLSWAILEYGDNLEAVKQLEYAQESLKWITDYLINAHPFSDVLYIQGRPLFQVNSSFPGTEVAAETAAALASASLVYKKINLTYSEILLVHAQQLFTFADTHRGSYSVSIPQVQKYYNSSGYGDELLWAGGWLYHATGDPSYLNYVTEQNQKAFGNLDISNVENLDLQMYRETAEILMCGLLPDSPTATTSRTNSGLIWIVQWNSLQHSVASAFLAVLYNYVLGKNPLKMSYVVGYGSNYPQYIHHRGSSIPKNASTGCSDGFKWYNSTSPNPNIAVGALVGGPFFNETYNDFRNNSMQGEPTTYNGALMVALLSGLVATSSVVRSF
ncbi:endoglucanase 24-like [Senna tora]|uniref:Endoglucanase n=1 Tax=Senna tora TaxID=362788 RepID=A0A834STW0_9FABA|nr:endoglucanase 24-like [Senna tora]